MVPSVIYSDHGSNLKSTKKLLDTHLGPLAPEWRFIVPRSPWWGCWWERLVGSMKSCLKKAVGTRCLTKVELETTLSEVEAATNSRPLTFVGSDVETKNPLTPNHFLSGGG